MNKTKRRIFNTAIKLFSEKGYDNTNIEEITAIAGVAKGSLYYHFSKKEDIFDLLLEEGIKLLKNNIEIKCKNCETSLEKIKAVIMVQIKITVRYEYLVNILLSEMWGEDTRSQKSKKIIYEYIGIIEEIIKKGIEDKEFYDGNVEALAAGIFGITCSSLIYRLKKNREVDIQNVYNGFIDTVVRGIIK